MSLAVRAHWYLAVICFPGLTGPVYEQNPLDHSAPSEENPPDHCRPLSPDRDGLDDASVDPLAAVPEAPTAAQAEPPAKETDGGPEAPGTATPPGTGLAEPEQQYTSEPSVVHYVR